MPVLCLVGSSRSICASETRKTAIIIIACNIRIAANPSIAGNPSIAENHRIDSNQRNAANPSIEGGRIVEMTAEMTAEITGLDAKVF